MNFKKNWKRFFTVSRASEGFTLVELIVVIAILAILAGIAVPAYSGYIKKANKAADLQLLGAVNTAFAASVLENGDDVNTVTRANIELQGPVGAKHIDMDRVTPYAESFERYFAGNESATFKVIERLAFVNGVFVDAATAEGVTAVTYGGGTIYVTDAQLQALRESSYNTDIGFDVLFAQIDGMTGSSAVIGGGAVDEFLSSNPAYWEDMILSFDGSLPTLNRADYESDAAYEEAYEEALIEEFETTMGGVINEIIARENNVDVENVSGLANYESLVEQYQGTVSGNLAVLYASQNASQQTSEGIMAIINSNDPKNAITSQIGADAGGAFGDAALVYSVFTAYANSANDNNYSQGLVDNFANNPTGVFDALQTDATLRENFQDYMNTTEGQADLNAALSAMDVVNSSAADRNALLDVLANGFNNDEFIGMVNGLMGNNG